MNVSKNMLKDYENVSTEDFDVLPCNTGVLLQPYNDNPYKKIEKTKSGLIIGIESTQKYKSNDTGEIEENDEFVACAKVIAVGPACKNCKVREDVFFIKHIAIPVPYRKMNYWTISEQNILCRIVKK